MLLSKEFVNYLIFILGFEVSFAYYCNITSEHLLCGIKSFNKRCGNLALIRYGSITKNERKEILETHNLYRNDVAAGKADGANGKFPQAANMEELIWDEELEAMSDSFVKSCLFEHNCPDCGKTKRFDTGENLHFYKTTGDIQSTLIPWKNIIDSWSHKEAKLYDVKDVKALSDAKNNLGNEFAQTGHLTQVIWAETRRVGCSRIAYKKPDTKASEALSICMYGPGGNILREKVYQKGLPCTMCEKYENTTRTCSKKYPQLCDAHERKDESAPTSLIDNNIARQLRVNSFLIFGCCFILGFAGK